MNPCNDSLHNFLGDHVLRKENYGEASGFCLSCFIETRRLKQHHFLFSEAGSYQLHLPARRKHLRRCNRSCTHNACCAFAPLSLKNFRLIGAIDNRLPIANLLFVNINVVRINLERVGELHAVWRHLQSQGRFERFKTATLRYDNNPFSTAARFSFKLKAILLRNFIAGAGWCHAGC